MEAVAKVAMHSRLGTSERPHPFVTGTREPQGSPA